MRATIGAIFAVVALLGTCACAPRPVLDPRPSMAVTAGLLRADGLVAAGCYTCLQDALAIYERLAAAGAQAQLTLTQSEKQCRLGRSNAGRRRAARGGGVLEDGERLHQAAVAARRDERIRPRQFGGERHAGARVEDGTGRTGASAHKGDDG